MIELDAESKKSLLRRARAAIARAIGADSGIASIEENPVYLRDPASTEPAGRVVPFGLEEKAGAFVTLTVDGALRGCIGYPEPEMPLVAVIDHCAVSAAISDPRFPALGRDEWDAIEVEISVLGPIERVADLTEVIVGQHGLIVEAGRRRGLLLPQVAGERHWTATEFAAQTCLKAGLSRDAWQNGAALFRFEADVFGESDLRV